VLRKFKKLIECNCVIEFHQEHVHQEHHGRGIVAPLILFSDKTALSKDRKISGHPIYLTIANISCEDRYLPEGHCLLAILPNFNVKESNPEKRLEAFQKCLTRILQPLKDASHK
jgi:hypothetical protein